MGQGSGSIHDVKSSRDIIREMIAEAEEVIAKMAKLARVRA
jgi:NAD(P)H-dependent flavin oxidoreductase YrpB (nitropropane dioxygenase family)